MSLSKRANAFLFVALLASALPLRSQTTASDANTSMTTLQINSRAVLVDVLVTDRSGKPVTGLKQDAFTVLEQGKPQTISFFEEHTGAPSSTPKEMPKLPPDVFSNFSPFPDPPAVNLLLLDSLNTQMENQSQVHVQALKFLKSAKPGTRMAVFTMGLGLHFVQGFTDDPALLVAALDNKKNNEVQSSVMLTSQEGSNSNGALIGMMSAIASTAGGVASPGASPATIAALQNFMDETAAASNADRSMLTLENLQRLATFLNGFPGRKNVIWFSQSFPLIRQRDVDPQIASLLANTMAMLAAARVALYPVDSRGVKTASFFQADNKLPSSISAPSQIVGVDNAPAGSPAGAANSAAPASQLAGDHPQTSPGSLVGSIEQEDQDRAGSRYTEEELAKETGGEAFPETNGFAQVIDDITSSSADFYTLSYVPNDQKLDGSYRKIDVKVAGGRYDLSFRRGYPATDAALPGSALAARTQAIKKLAAQNPGAVDPLRSFMDLGMPQIEQILYKVKIQPAPPKTDTAAADEKVEKSNGKSYGVDFAIDLKDLDLKLDSEGLHKGVVDISLIAYDRYGHIGSRKDFLVPLNIKPDVYSVAQSAGVQLHGELAVPTGNFWLRTGVYDQGSGKVGTMEVALSSVVALPTSIDIKTTMGSESTKPPALVPPATEVIPVRASAVTVEHLEHMIADAHGKRDQDLAKKLGEMQLSERLSSPRLAKIQAGLPGEKSRLALVALADASAFLEPPAAEIPATPPPDMTTQKLILSRAADNLVSAIHKLPDLFARQTTVRFHDMKVSKSSSASAPVVEEHQAFQPLDSFGNTVYYRDGKEFREADQKQQKDQPRSSDGLVDRGVFGQLQRNVMKDIYEGKVEWSHWEQGGSGPVAVFRYSIPKEKSTYSVDYCCIGLPNQNPFPFQSVPPFHGEIAIDPESGAVYRLVIITELTPSDPILQADLVVEYEPVDIGGQFYVCPRKSIALTTAMVQTLPGAGCAKSTAWLGCNMQIYKPRDTAINDTIYDSYHVFRSEVRMLPAGATDSSAPQQQKPPADRSAPPTSTAPEHP
jgi:VWFA-related protein